MNMKSLADVLAHGAHGQEIDLLEAKVSASNGRFST